MQCKPVRRDIYSITNSLLSTGMTRRQALKRAMLVGASVPVFGGLMVACADDELDDTAPVDTDDDEPDPADEPDDDTEEPVDDDHEETDDVPEVDDDEGPVTEGGVLTGAFDVGPGGCPECFNPLTATAGFTWLEKYFSKLVLYDVDFTEIQGELAESWEINDDASEYTLNLQEGVLWHDGEAFTSEDVRFSLDLVREPGVGSHIASNFDSIGDIETPDDQTVVISLESSNAALLDGLTFLCMLPEHELGDIPADEVGESEWWSENPIGTGPFKWREYAEGQYVELEAFDDYWRGRPNLDGIINRYYPEAGSAVIALRAGDISFTYLGADEAADLEGEDDLEIKSGPSHVANFLGFNLRDPRLEDVRVRQAFMYAIDRDAIVAELFDGTATKVPCIFHNELYLPDDAEEYAYDPDRARELLDEAGWEDLADDLNIEVMTYYEDQLSNDVLVTMQQMLAEVGVEISLRIVDVPTYNQERTNYDEWALIYAGAANGPDPDSTASYYRSDATLEEGGSNIYDINDSDLDQLYSEGRQESDPEARAEIYQDVCSILNEQLYWGPMWVSERFGAVSTDVENFVWTPAPGGGRYYDAAEEWSLPE